MGCGAGVVLPPLGSTRGSQPGPSLPEGPLEQGLRRVSADRTGNKYATAEDGRWHLSSDPSERLAPDAEARLHRLKGWLARHMPAIRLPDLLIEVDNDLRFTTHFLGLPRFSGQFLV